MACDTLEIERGLHVPVTRFEESLPLLDGEYVLGHSPSPSGSVSPVTVARRFCTFPSTPLSSLHPLRGLWAGWDLWRVVARFGNLLSCAGSNLGPSTPILERDPERSTPLISFKEPRSPVTARVHISLIVNVTYFYSRFRGTCIIYESFIMKGRDTREKGFETAEMGKK